MSRSFDLGTTSFNDPESGQCLLSQTTITLLCPESSAVLPVDLDHILKERNWWVNCGRTVGIDVFIQGNREDLGPILDLLEHVVDILQTLLMRSDIDPVILDRLHDYNSDTPNVITIMFSFLLQPNIREKAKVRCRIPRRVRKFVVIDPQPPQGITTASLSHVRIFCTVSPRRTEGDRSVTRLWLGNLISDLPESVDADHFMTSTKEFGTRLCPANTSLLMSSPHRPQLLGTVSCSDNYCGGERVGRPDNPSHISLCGRGSSFLDLLGHAIQSAILVGSPPVIGAIGDLEIDAKPRLAEIAPFLFNSTYKNSISHRAGLIPAVAKSLETILGKTTSEQLRKRSIAVKDLADTCYGATAAGENGSFRSLLKCLLWTSLQNGVYKGDANEKYGLFEPTTDSTGDDSFMFDDSSWTDTDLLSSHQGVDSELADTDSDDQFTNLDDEQLGQNQSGGGFLATFLDVEDCSDDRDVSDHWPAVSESERCKSESIDAGSESSDLCNDPSLAPYPVSPLAIDSDMLSSCSELGNDSETDMDLIDTSTMNAEPHAWSIGEANRIEGEEMLD